MNPNKTNLFLTWFLLSGLIIHTGISGQKASLNSSSETKSALLTDNHRAKKTPVLVGIPIACKYQPQDSMQ